MVMAQYNSLMYTGRFQPPHLGHVSVVEKGLELADQLIIMVGSSQIDGSAEHPFTVRNPFSAQLRADMWHDIYGDRVLTALVPDRTHENDNDGEWGRWLLRYCTKGVGFLPNGMIYSDDEGRSDWFYVEDRAAFDFIVLPRDFAIEISATQLREFIARNEYQSFQYYTPHQVHYRFNQLREQLLSQEFYWNIANGV
jgi:cytidyltransferase-like protein